MVEVLDQKTNKYTKKQKEKIMEKPSGTIRKSRREKTISNIEKVKYFYFRDDKNMPFITVCSICVNNTWHKGVSFCNHKDTFSKKRGREISYGRAIFAAMNNLTYYCKNPNKRVLAQVNLTVHELNDHLHNNLPFPPPKNKK
jgi:hypothetical protein